MKIIVDGNNLACMAFFVTKNILSTKKRVIKTVGLFNIMMQKLKVDFAVSNLYIAWDGISGADWRKEILPEYKSNRLKQDPVLTKIIKEAQNLSYYHFILDYAEGDDMVYALCNALHGKKVIVSSDKDFIQVVQEGLAHSIFIPNTKKYRDIPNIDSVLEKSICGDSSDNLKGIPGYGPVATKKLIANNFIGLTDAELFILRKHERIIGLQNNPKAGTIYAYAFNKIKMYKSVKSLIKKNRNNYKEHL